MAIVAEETGIVVLLVDVVLQEVEGVSSRFPIGKDDSDVVVDGDVRVLIHRLADSTEVPAFVFVPSEKREVERLIRRQHEIVPHPGIFTDPPPGALGEDQPIVAPAPDIGVGVRMLGIDQRDAAIGVDAEDGRVRVTRGAIVDTHFVTPLQHGIRTPIEPDAGLERVLHHELGLIVRVYHIRIIDVDILGRARIRGEPQGHEDEQGESVRSAH